MNTPETQLAEIRRRLNAILDAGLLRQIDIAAKCGISQPHLSKIVRGVMPELKPETTNRLVSFLNANPPQPDLPPLELIEVPATEAKRDSRFTVRSTGHGVGQIATPSLSQERTTHRSPQDVLLDIEALVLLVDYANFLAGAFASQQPDVRLPHIVLKAVKHIVSGELYDRYRSTCGHGNETPSRARLVRLANFMVSPNRITDELDFVRADLRLASLPVPTERHDALHLLGDSDASTLHVSTTADRGPVAARARSVRFCTADIPFDLASILLGYLVSRYDFTVYRAYQQVQWWVRHTYNLHYTETTRGAIIDLSARLRSLFFGRQYFSRSEIRELHSESVDLPYFLAVVTESLHASYCAMEQTDQRALAAVPTQAVGLLLLMRLSRILRLTYRWGIDPDELPLPADATATFKPLEISLALNYAFDAEYFLARAFGASSTIQGLDFIFRGGLLPNLRTGMTVAVLGRPGSGKSLFALQLVSDVAARGGLALYLSLEESTDSIYDRVRTFGIGDLPSFSIIVNDDDDFSQLRDAAAKRAAMNRELDAHWHKQQPRTGVLVIHQIRAGKGKEITIDEIIDRFDCAADGNWRRKALVIDSLNSLYFNGEQPDHEVVSMPRSKLFRLVNAIAAKKYMGILVAESEDDGSTLAGISQIVLKLGMIEARRRRTIEIVKSRNQNYHPGEHDFSIREGRGVKIYPSLASIRSALRRRPRIQPSESKTLTIEPLYFQEAISVMAKSTGLVIGAARSGKSAFVSQWLASPYETRSIRTGAPVPEFPQGVLVVSFRDRESQYRKRMSFYMNDRLQPLGRHWEQIADRNYRWFSPGDNITAGQIVDEVWTLLQRKRRQGRPIERIVFEDIEVVDDILPTVAADRLFWISLFELVTTEPVSTLFTVAAPHKGEPCAHPLLSHVDYVFEVGQQDGKPVLECLRRPIPTSLKPRKERSGHDEPDTPRRPEKR